VAEPLIARSALRSHVAPENAASAPGIVLRERADLTLASVATFKGRETELADAVRSAYGIELPTTPKRVAAEGVAFVWAGPGKWLATGTGVADFSALPAAVADQSDGRSVLSVSGEKARETLATLIAIDLHPRAFSPGDAALTHAASISVHLWQTDDAPSYEIAVFRSYAATLWRWLVHAGQSRGIDAKL
jgi:sarcosine oxidase subunit gamma